MAEPTKPQTAAPSPEVPKLYADEVNLKYVEGALKLQPQRVRRLVIEGKVPSAKKNAQGFWRFSKAAVDTWVANRPKGTRQSKDGKKPWMLRLSPDEYKTVSSALEGTGLQLVSPYANRKKYVRKTKATPAVEPEEEE